MAIGNLVLLESDHSRLVGVLDRFLLDSNAKLAFLVDKNGQQLAASGDLGAIDAVSLATLAAGNVAATDGLAKVIGERDFSILFHEGERDHLHVNVIAGWAILLVLFDLRSSLGLVRLRARKATADLAAILEEVAARSAAMRGGAFGALYSIPEITDEDIDALFG